MNIDFKGQITPISYEVRIPSKEEQIENCWVFERDVVLPYKNTLTLSMGNRSFSVPGSDGVFISSIVSMIERAKYLICLSSFLLEAGDVTSALLKARNRGVYVVILTAPRELKSCDNDEEISERQKEILEKHRKLLNSFINHILIRTASHFHAKYLLCDPVSDSATGIMMTCNATVDAMSGGNIEFAVGLKQNEIQSFYAHFLHGFWTESEHELLEKGKLSTTENSVPQSVLEDLGSVTLPVTRKDTTTLRDTLSKMIDSAKKTITISAWTFEKDYELVNKLLAKQKQGVKVTIYTRVNFFNTGALLKVAKAGAIIYGYPRFHAKCLIVDDIAGLIMTANISKLGLDSGFESAILLDKTDIGTLNNILEKLSVERSHVFFSRISSANLSKGTFKVFVEGKQELQSINISDEKIESRIVVKYSSCDKYLDYSFVSQDAFKKQDKLEYVKTHIYPIVFEFPKLSRNAKIDETDKKLGIPVYISKKNGQESRSILVKNWEEVEKLKHLSANGYHLVIE